MTPPAQRLRELDGLRGAAALVVVLHHLALLSATVSNRYLVPGSPPIPVGSPLWFITSLPGSDLLATTAVLVFFVLSGVVLTLPALKPGFDMVAYYPRRIVRLLVPVLGALVLSYLLAVVTPQDPATAGSLWASWFSLRDPDPWKILSGVELLAGDPALDNPLWSLRYELIYSLFLPASLVIAVAVRRWWPAAIAVCLLLVAVSDDADSLVLRYLPVFVIGGILAVALPSVRAAADRMPRGARLAAGAGAALLVIALLILRGTLFLALPHGPFFDEVAVAVPALIALLIVLVALLWAPLAWLLTTLPLRWLGRVSFSLYLVHVPVLLSINALLPGTPWYLVAALSLPVVLIAAELFARFIEGPAHTASRRVGEWSRRVLDRA